MNKIRVGVLMGGKSIEREVSFNSGRTVCDHLDTARYDIIPIFQTAAGTLYILPWHFLHRGKIADFEHRLATQARHITWDDIPELIDFMYLAVHGKYAEDGTVQGFLEILGVPYLGSKVFSSALCMDKAVQKEFLKHNGIDVPASITVTPDQVRDFDIYQHSIEQQLAAERIPLPYVVKPHQEGSSLGITVVFDTNDLHEALKRACFVDPHKAQSVLIEEKVSGMEFSCITITDYNSGVLVPLPPTEIVPEPESHFYDYEQKYMPGRAQKFTPARCDTRTIQRIHDVCIQTTHALGITNISRIDGFVTEDNRIVIVDPNTLSGMGPASFLFREAAEINMGHTQLINHLIETELHAYGMLDTATFSTQEKQTSMETHKTRVAVLMGGNSNEREISLESGRNITFKLSPHKYTVIPLFVSSSMELYKLNQSLLVRNSTKEIESMVDKSSYVAWNDLPNIADFVFIGLHGGAGENGSVQGALEMLGVPYNGSGILASSLCMDKYKTTQFLHSKGIDVPRGLLIAHHEWLTNKEALLETITTTIGLPAIIKPHDDGCSVMVAKANNTTDLVTHIETIFAHGKNHALVEECIVGMELTVGVIGNEKPQALPPSQTVTASDILSIEEKFLPGAGENQTPAPLPEQTLTLVQRTMERAYEFLGCRGYARIDCFYQSAAQSPTGAERVVIIEVNTLPGMTPATCIFHQAAEIGIKPMDFIDLIIKFGFEEHKQSVKLEHPARETKEKSEEYFN
ncbi:MAG: ATP-grasp domain-containing protein [Candidatus Babeliales bacterium]